MPDRWPIGDVDWSRLPGCYGVERDVRGALEILRFGTDAGSDEFSDALDVLYGHVWHQGDIFPVTAHVLPFVFDIVDCSPALASLWPARSEIAMFVTCSASSARRAMRSPRSSDRACSEEVLATLLRHADRLRAWARSELRPVAFAAMLNVPELADGALSGKEGKLEHVLAAVLTHSRWLDQSILSWGGRELPRISSHPVALRASELLLATRLGAVAADDARLVAVAEALAGPGTLEKGLDPLRELFGLVTSYAMANESRGVVAVSDDDWFVVEAARKLTIRWPSHPFNEGDEVVLVDINERNCAREVRGVGSQSHHAATFDERGRLMRASPR